MNMKQLSRPPRGPQPTCCPQARHTPGCSCTHLCAHISKLCVSSLHPPTASPPTPTQLTSLALPAYSSVLRLHTASRSGTENAQLGKAARNAAFRAQGASLLTIKHKGILLNQSLPFGWLCAQVTLVRLLASSSSERRTGRCEKNSVPPKLKTPKRQNDARYLASISVFHRLVSGRDPSGTCSEN